MKFYTRKVHYYETDQMGVVHHSNYARFFEEARMDYWDQVGLDYHQMEQDGILVPVLACSCRYKKPLRYPQAFTVVATLKEFNGVRFCLEYQIYVDGSKDPVALGETEHCFANKAMHPIRIEKRYPQIMDKVLTMLSHEGTYAF